jgi:hypothetical protein
MKNLVIIGTSKIIEEHIKCLVKLKFKILAICSSRKKSTNLSYLSKKYKIKNSFDNYIDCEKFLGTNNKDFAFFLGPRIKDTENILLKCLKYKKKVFIEKPITKDLNFIKKIKNYNNNIFVGYNRIFYQNIAYIKKNICDKKNLFIEVSCPENNKYDISTNSCHIISILFYLFGKIEIINIQRNVNYILIIAKIKLKGLITIRFNFNSSENFSINIIDKTKLYILKPIENLNVYDKIMIIKKNNFKSYIPISRKNINEFKHNTYKPGFLKQAKEFEMFLNKNKKIFNDLNFAKMVINFCNKINYDSQSKEKT